VRPGSLKEKKFHFGIEEHPPRIQGKKRKTFLRRKGLSSSKGESKSSCRRRRPTFEGKGTRLGIGRRVDPKVRVWGKKMEEG